MTAPGWYKDPVDRDVQRYWDGDGWIGEPVPASEPTPTEPPVIAPPPPPPVTPPVGPAGPVPSATQTAGGPIVTTPGVPLPQGAVVLPPGTPIPPGGFPPGQLPPGAIVLPPGTPLPPGLLPQGQLPAGAVQVLLPPQAAFTMPAAIRPHGYALAPLGKRLLARLVDILVVGVIIAAATGWLIYQYVREVGPVVSEFQRRYLAGEPVGDLAASDRAQYLQIVILILIAAVWFAYEVPSIAGSGQTLGKRLLKIKVVGLDADKPLGVGRAIRRWNPLGLWVLLWTCGVGFVLQFIDALSPVIDWPLHRAIHDRAAGTVVVMADRDPSYEPPASNDGDQS
ncbi:RDD family protein [Dactylosporangium sp. NPDC051541]|uniref:RDD family protein n=1 Tax=Dactylosporangium sp. NPDC051541 TaxID=3363977 RepID=UPI0037B4DF6A